MKKAIPVIAIFGLLTAAPLAQAAAPQLVPVQGVLTDSAGDPIDSTVTAVFSIYTSEVGGTALWTETQSVLVEDGLFTAYMGDVTTLDLTLFRDNGNLWLGIQIGSDAEMDRVLLGSNPFAGYAEWCGNHPTPDFSDITGTVDPADLPTGVVIGAQACTGTEKVSGIDSSGAVVCTADEDTDTLYTAGAGLSLAGTTFSADVTYLQRRVTGTCAAGSAMSAVAADGTVTCSGVIPAGAVMFFNLTSCPTGWSALSAAQGRAVVGLPSGGTLAGTVGSAMSNLANPTHTHSVDPAAVASSAGGVHNHAWAYNDTDYDWMTWLSNGTSTMVLHYYGGGDGVAEGTASSYPLMSDMTSAPTSNIYYYTADSATHTHAVDVAATTSTATSHVTPYIQLLACQKD